MPTLSRNIIISVALALLAAAALVLYTSRLRQEAADVSDAVRVVVATRDIPSGTPVEEAFADGDLAYQNLRRGDVADGAFQNVDAAEGQVVTSDMFENDQLTASRTGRPQTQGLSYRISGNQRAIEIPLNRAAGLLGDVVAGDRVDVFTNYRDADTVVTFPAVRAALVLASEVPADDVSGTGAGSLTLAVTDEEAMRIVNALRNAQGGTETDSAIWMVATPRTGATQTTLGPLSLPN
jgi:pilus assembly protein CpaB